MNNIDEINNLLYSAGLHRFLGLKGYEELVLIGINLNKYSVICLDLEYNETSNINKHFEYIKSVLNIFLSSYNNYSNKTYKNISFGYFEINETKYGNCIYLFNSKSYNLGYEEIYSKGITLNQDGKIIKSFNILQKNNDNQNLKLNIKETETKNGLLDGQIKNGKNYEIIKKMVKEENISKRNLMEYFGQTETNQIFNYLKDIKVFEIKENDRNGKYYNIKIFNQIDEEYFEKYTNIGEY